MDCDGGGGMRRSLRQNSEYRCKVRRGTQGTATHAQCAGGQSLGCGRGVGAAGAERRGWGGMGVQPQGAAFLLCGAGEGTSQEGPQGSVWAHLQEEDGAQRQPRRTGAPSLLREHCWARPVLRDALGWGLPRPPQDHTPVFSTRMGCPQAQTPQAAPYRGKRHTPTSLSLAPGSVLTHSCIPIQQTFTELVAIVPAHAGHWEYEMEEPALPSRNTQTQEETDTYSQIRAPPPAWPHVLTCGPRAE